jgi:hypothetical protein
MAENPPQILRQGLFRQTMRSDPSAYQIGEMSMEKID